MRIGDYDLRNIKSKILDDLYGSEQKKFHKRKEEIAKQNREIWLDKYRHLLDQLPESMVTRHSDYYVRVKYTPNVDKTEIMIDEKWEYKMDKPGVNPVDDNSGGYTSAAESPLNDKLQFVAAKLCDEILALRKEKSEIESFLNETTRKYKGSLQLRKVWPESMHKYLPAEPVRVGKKNKPTTPDPVVPATLNTRLTTNLLEDN